MVGSIAFSVEDIRSYSAKTGLGFQFCTKEAFLFEAMEVFSQKEFVLKGGTAINKGYLAGHQRFSEDLDYDTNLSKKEVENFIISLNWKIKKRFYTKNTVGYMFAYVFNDVQDVIKVEVSFGVDGKFEKKKMISDFLPISKIVQTYAFEELNWQKEQAIINRREWKDLYDLYWMSKNDGFKIRNKLEFVNAIKNLVVPKTANAYIPITKRPNWDEVKEVMMSL